MKIIFCIIASLIVASSCANQQDENALVEQIEPIAKPTAYTTTPSHDPMPAQELTSNAVQMFEPEDFIGAVNQVFGSFAECYYHTVYSSTLSIIGNPTAGTEWPGVGLSYAMIPHLRDVLQTSTWEPQSMWVNVFDFDDATMQTFVTFRDYGDVEPLFFSYQVFGSSSPTVQYTFVENTFPQIYFFLDANIVEVQMRRPISQNEYDYGADTILETCRFVLTPENSANIMATFEELIETYRCLICAEPPFTAPPEARRVQSFVPDDFIFVANRIIAFEQQGYSELSHLLNLVLRGCKERKDIVIRDYMATHLPDIMQTHLWEPVKIWVDGDDSVQVFETSRYYGTAGNNHDYSIYGSWVNIPEEQLFSNMHFYLDSNIVDVQIGIMLSEDEYFPGAVAKTEICRFVLTPENAANIKAVFEELFEKYEESE